MTSSQERLDHVEKELRNLAASTQTELIALRKDLNALFKSQSETDQKLRACQDALRDLTASAPAKSSQTARAIEPAATAPAERASSTCSATDYAEECRQMSLEMNLAWAKGCAKWGSLGEDLLLRNLPPIVQKILNQEITQSAASMSHCIAGRRAYTFYGIAASENMVFLNNTVEHLSNQEVDGLVQIIADFRRCYPDCRNKVIIGIAAGITVDESAVEYGEKLGFLVLAVGVEPLEVQNRPGFEPKRW